MRKKKGFGNRKEKKKVKGRRMEKKEAKEIGNSLNRKRKEGSNWLSRRGRGGGGGEEEEDDDDLNR